MQKSLSEGRNTSYRTAELVKLISEIGPDIPEISRRLGQFKESVRYRYKEKVLGRGFGVQAIVDHQKIGLRRVLMIVNFSPMFRPFGSAILSAMNELCFVVYFERRMLYDDYVVTASVPIEHVPSFLSFMTRLKENGIFSELEMVSFDWFRIVPMRTERYDFDTGRWDFDWSNPLKSLDDAAYLPSEKLSYDMTDLLILKELQIDATRSLTEISQRLKLNYKTLSWHLKNHVQEKRLISGYYLRWMGTTYSTKLERALHRQHRYQHIGLLSTNLTTMERIELIAKFHTVPFLWSEMGGEHEYYADFYFPTENVLEAFQFLTESIGATRQRTSVMVLNQSEALSFTLSYQLYNNELKAWIFNENELLSRFGKLAQEIRETGGSKA